MPATFRSLYDTWNPLEDVRDRALKVLSPEGSAKLLPIPAKGSLDLSQMENCEFCFS